MKGLWKQCGLLMLQTIQSLILFLNGRLVSADDTGRSRSLSPAALCQFVLKAFNFQQNFAFAGLIIHEQDFTHYQQARLPDSFILL